MFKLVNFMNFAFLENFQEPPGRLFIDVRRLMCLEFSGFLRRGTAWRHIPGRQAIPVSYPLGFVWIAWRWWTPTRRCESIWLDFWCFGVLGWFWSGEKTLIIV